MSQLIEIKQMSYARGSRKIFESLDITIQKGQLTAILGPSGSGKTTLLKMIAGDLYPQAGVVNAFGQSVHQLSRQALLNYRKQIGFLFQSGALFTDLTVFENVAFPLREHTALSESLIRRLVWLKLEAVGLRGAATQLPNQLSGGQVRRAALARAIALDPSLLIYDEPFAGQDPLGMAVLLKLIATLNQALKLTSIVITHDVKEILGIADYVYMICEGKVIEHGTPNEIKQSKQAWVQQFIGGLKQGPVPFHLPAPDFRECLWSD